MEGVEPQEHSDSFRKVASMTVAPISSAQAERFRQLAWPMLPVVLRTAQCLTHRLDQAEDLAQETMMKAMRAIDSFEEGTNIKAWLLTILRRTHIDRVRSTQNRPSQLSLTGIDWLNQPTESSGEHDGEWEQPEELMSRFEDESILEALREIPDDIRWTLLLVDVEQMEQQNAAEVLGVPVGTIKSRAHRGRAMLRDRLYTLACQRGWVTAAEKSS